MRSANINKYFEIINQAIDIHFTVRNTDSEKTVWLAEGHLTRKWQKVDLLFYKLGLRKDFIEERGFQLDLKRKGKLKLTKKEMQ